MRRRKFIILGGTAVVIAGVTYYLSSDKTNAVRPVHHEATTGTPPLTKAEREILYLASLAPSGHNTQPWLVKYIEPFHWVICNDKTKWLSAVDPTQRETILSIGAFLQNLEYAAKFYGFQYSSMQLALTNQDEEIVDVTLTKAPTAANLTIDAIKLRRTVRSGYQSEALKKEDLSYLIENEADFIHYIPNDSKEHRWLNEQTIEANRLQSYRDDAQGELADWIRFSSEDARTHADGLTLAGMEIDGIPAWILRNFYKKADIMKNKFREQSIDKVAKQVKQSAGWLIISSNDYTVKNLLETGQRMQRLFLKVRSKNIAIHPMTQIIEEPSTNKALSASIGVQQPIQFILRTGYITDYPAPVTLRRSVNRFLIT